MSGKISPMGIVLRTLCGEDGGSGSGPIEIMTRTSDFNVVTLQDPQGNPVSAPANSLVAFTAQSFRELNDADVWEFRVQAPTPGGPTTWALMYLSGADVFLVRSPSKVAF